MGAAQWGNPSPIGLFGFIVTTAIDMFVVMQWVEKEFELYIASYGLMFGGILQALAGILCLFKGDTYSAALFTLYGGYWMSFGVHGIVLFSTSSPPEQINFALSALKALVGFITFLFWTLAHRKSLILWLILPCVYMLLFLQAAAYATNDNTTMKASGYFGFFASVLALYSVYGELANEEFGRAIIPGLQPIWPTTGGVTPESIARRLTYDKRSNTLSVHFKGLIVNSEEDIRTIYEAIEKKVESAVGAGNKVRCVANYDEVNIRKDLVVAYWEAAQLIQQKHYLSIERFNADVFTLTKPNDNLPTMTRLRGKEGAIAVARSDAYHSKVKEVDIKTARPPMSRLGAAADEEREIRRAAAKPAAPAAAR